MRVATGVILLLCSACGTPGSNLRVDLPGARAPTPTTDVALEVGRLLGADEAASQQAARRLATLDDNGREALRAHALLIPTERDPRWQNLLFDHHMLPPLAPQEELEFLLWKAARPSGPDRMSAQHALVGFAQREPALLEARVAAGELGWERLAIALAQAQRTEAVPALLARYRRSTDTAQRMVLADALASLLGKEQRPLVAGSPEELEAEAQRLDAWYRDHLEVRSDAS